MTKRCYSEERHIAASAETVWQLIADFAHYTDWNPWIVHAEGDTAPGSAVTVTARFGGHSGQYRHRMIAANCPTDFHWCDVGWFTLFAKGERIRWITPIDDGHCHYRVELRISGIAAGLADRQYGDFMRGGLKAEADALKATAEQR